MKTRRSLQGLKAWLSFFLILSWTVSSLLSPRFCDAESLEKVTCEGFSAGIDHLLSLSSKRESTSFDLSAIRPVIDFVASEKPPGTLYHAGDRDGIPSAYHEFHVGRDLDAILRYAYNPGIPANVFRPSSVRLTQWLEVGGEKKPVPGMWTFLRESATPAVVTGVEYEENTPELATGACYGYTMDRALVLLRDGDRDVFISISKQRGPSEKGKKGACLGEDKNWDYLYTDEEGLTRRGLGWADTYIYEAYSIAVFCEQDRGASRVRCGVFKWIRAGWAGMNLVKHRHIHEGLIRFSEGFRETIEDARLPEPDRLARMFAWIESLPEKALRGKVNDYFRGIRARYPGEKVLSKGCFEAYMETGDYAGRMTRVQMESLVALEYMKWLLGRNTVLGEEFRFGPMPDSRRISREFSPVSPSLVAAGNIH